MASLQPIRPDRHLKRPSQLRAFGFRVVPYELYVTNIVTLRHQAVVMWQPRLHDAEWGKHARAVSQHNQHKQVVSTASRPFLSNDMIGWRSMHRSAGMLQNPGHSSFTCSSDNMQLQWRDGKNYSILRLMSICPPACLALFLRCTNARRSMHAQEQMERGNRSHYEFLAVAVADHMPAVNAQVV